MAPTTKAATDQDYIFMQTEQGPQNSHWPAQAASKKNIWDVSMEKKLFHALHINNSDSNTNDDGTVRRPPISVKEFNENYAFVNAVKSCFKKSRTNSNQVDVIIDVAGGHGALCALFLILMPSIQRGIVIDPAVCKKGKEGIQKAWGEYLVRKSKAKLEINSESQLSIQYIHEDLRSALPRELQNYANDGSSRKKPNILVVACHACAFLSEDIISISQEHANVVYGIAVMPCCQKDTSPGSWWKSLNKQKYQRNKVESKHSSCLNIPIEIIMDLLLAGKAMSISNRAYDVRMKLIDNSITPQNRIIICKRRNDYDSIFNNGIDDRNEVAMDKDKAYKKLTNVYRKAHNNNHINNDNKNTIGNMNQKKDLSFVKKSTMKVNKSKNGEQHNSFKNTKCSYNQSNNTTSNLQVIKSNNFFYGAIGFFLGFGLASTISCLTFTSTMMMKRRKR